MSDNSYNGRRSYHSAMRLLISTLAALVLVACTPVQRDASAREWQRAQCDHVLDSTDRERCLKRVDETYGSSTRTKVPPPARRP